MKIWLISIIVTCFCTEPVNVFCTQFERLSLCFFCSGWTRPLCPFRKRRTCTRTLRTTPPALRCKYWCFTSCSWSNKQNSAFCCCISLNRCLILQKTIAQVLVQLHRGDFVAADKCVRESYRYERVTSSSFRSPVWSLISVILCSSVSQGSVGARTVFPWRRYWRRMTSRTRTRCPASVTHLYWSTWTTTWVSDDSPHTHAVKNQTRTSLRSLKQSVNSVSVQKEIYNYIQSHKTYYIKYLLLYMK